MWIMARRFDKGAYRHRYGQADRGKKSAVIITIELGFAHIDWPAARGRYS